MNVHESISRDDKPSLVEIDNTRENNKAYQYLCHVEECKQWIEGMIMKSYRDITDFETQITNGIDLCLLATTYAKERIERIYYGKEKKQGENDYKYTDNIYFFIDSMRFIKLPETFIFETISLYERKNIPSVIYCLHALSHFLKHKGYSSKGIKSVYGVVFPQNLLDEKSAEIKEQEKLGIRIPEFGDIRSVIHKDVIDIFQAIVKASFFVKSNREQADREKKLKIKLESELKQSVDFKEKIVKNTSNTSSLFKKCKVLFLIRNGFINNAKLALKSKLRTFIYKKSFDELFTKRNISLFTLKFYLFVFFENYKEVEKERDIEKIVEECGIIKNQNYDIESYLEELIARVSLLLNNKINICNISVIKPKLEDVISHNYQFELEEYNFIFNTLQTEPEWFLTILENIEKTTEFVMQFMKPFFCKGKREENYLVDFYIYALNTINEEDKIIIFDNKIFSAVRTLMNTFYKDVSCKLKDDIILIISNLDAYDIENDPTVIFMNIFDQDVTREEALKNETVSKVYISRMKTLLTIVKTVIDVIDKNITQLSYTVRFYLKNVNQLFSENSLSDYTLSFFYKEFVYPLFFSPETYSDIKVNSELQSKLKIIILSFQCIIEGESCASLNILSKHFVDENQRLKSILHKIINVSDTNNEFSYYIADQRPFIILSCKKANKLIDIIKDNINSDEIHNFVEVFEKIANLKSLPDSEKILMFYLNKFIVPDQKNLPLQSMIKNAKMKIVELLRIANGRNLYDLLLRQSTEQEEVAFQCILNSIKRNDFRIRSLPYNNYYTENCEYPEIPLNYFFKDESDYVTAYSKDGDFFKTLDDYKEDLYDDMLKLEQLGIIRKENFYNDILYSLADDILKIRFMFSERRKNLEIHKKNLNQVREKKHKLETEMMNVETYLASFAASVIKKNNKNVKGRHDKYGSFSEKAVDLKRKLILVSMLTQSEEGMKYRHGDLNSCINDITFIFGCNEPAILIITVLICGEMIAEPFCFRFDELLKMRYRGVENLCVPEICLLNVKGMVEYVNEKYVLGK